MRRQQNRLFDPELDQYPLSPYQDPGLPGMQVQINEFSHRLRGFNSIAHSERTSQMMKLSLLQVVEGDLISIVQYLAIPGNGNAEYNALWAVANRREINYYEGFFERARIFLQTPRDENIRHMADAMDNFKKTSKRGARQYFDREIGKKSIAASTALYGGSALAAGGVATALSAASFSAGPEVGVPVTATVGTVSLVATIGCTIYGAVKGNSKGLETAEESVRTTFHV